ncbi:MAG: dienelactone hydrolase family protein [Hylemonella sp.]|nr:dienelactone hydrolase family protein [Hylemonella sp.]
MNRLPRILAVVLFAVLSTSVFAHKLPSWTRTAEGVPLEIRLADSAPNGTVIFAHGCNGPAQGVEVGWSDRFRDAGFNTVGVDSWQWRGISGGVCQTLAVSSEERVKEISLALNWIKQQPWHSGKIFMVGWSHGGGVAMAASTKKDLGLTKAVAVYPWCDSRFSDAVIPIQVHIGAADDWTPAYLCKNVYGIFWKNPLGQVFLYEGVHHSYDFFVHTDSQMPGIGMGNSVQLRTQRSDPVARDLTIDRVIEFFKN